MQRHGLSIGIERIDDNFFLSFKAVGKLTHEDYQTINPMLDHALAGIEQPHIRVLVDATEMSGWTLHAAWDDLKLGTKYRGKFEKIAIFGNSAWQDNMSKIGRWFVSGEVEYFDDIQQAYDWVRY